MPKVVAVYFENFYITQSIEKYTNPGNATKYAEIKIHELNEILQSREDKEETDKETILNKFNVLKK